MTGSSSTLLDIGNNSSRAPVQEQGATTRLKTPERQGISIPMHRLSNLADDQAGTPDSAPFESEPKVQDTGLKRRLQSKQMQMIAIGANMGTGLFIGSAKALYNGGPGWVLVDLILVAALLFFVVMALGELATTFPVSGSFVTYTSRFIDPSWGLAMGWCYWLQWFVALPIQLTVSTIIISKWDVNNIVPAGVWITLFLLITAMINFFGIRLYGQINYYMSMIKVTAVAFFVVLAIAIDVGAGPGNHYRGAKTWHDPGAFKNGMKGFCDLLVTAAFSLAGTELIGLTAAETANPRKEVPKATVQVFSKIVACYIISLFMIGLIVPSDDKRLTGDAEAPVSPFVLAIELAGLKVLPHIFNAIILMSLISVSSSCVYASSRTLVALAQLGQAPKIFGKIDSMGRPIPAILLAISFGTFAFSQYASSAQDIFDWLLALSGLSSIFTWTSVCYAHVRFRQAWKRQGHRLEELPWKTPTGMIGSIVGIAMNAVVMLAHFYTAVWPIDEPHDGSARAKAFFQAYLAAPVFLILYAIARIVLRCPHVELQDIDLQTGRRQISIEELAAERQADLAKPVWRRAYELCC